MNTDITVQSDQVIRKIKRLQNDVTELKTQGNVYKHINNIPEEVNIQKIKTHFKETSKQKCKEALNKLEIWVNKMNKSGL